MTIGDQGAGGVQDGACHGCGVRGVVDKEVTKQVEVYKELVMDMVVEEVNRELLKEFNEGLVLVCRCGDGLRGDHKVDGGGSGTGQEG